MPGVDDRSVGVSYGLLPGAGGSGWYWHLVEAEVRRRGHHVVVVDLPADDPQAGLAEYAEVVVKAIGDAPQLILVAQSLAGFTAPLVCDVAHGRSADAGFDLLTDFFYDVSREIFEAPAAHDRPQSERPFRDRWPLAAWPAVPTRVVVGRDDRFFPADFQRRIAKERLGLVADEVPGGHLVALSYPLPLVERLEEYRREILVGRQRN